MRETTRRAVLATMGALVLGAGVLVPGAAAAEPTPALRPAKATETHCSVVVTGQAEDGRLLTTEPTCHRDRAVVMARARAIAPLSFTIGVHYDLPTLGGSSFSVVGTSCIGGWLNLNGSWTNRVSSTLNGCPTILHFDGFNLTGDHVATTTPGGPLGAMNNRTNSIQYLP